MTLIDDPVIRGGAGMGYRNVSEAQADGSELESSSLTILCGATDQANRHSI